MKEKFIGVGLGVGAALTLGIVWTDAAHAFSLGRSVQVTNVLRDDKGKENPFDPSKFPTFNLPPNPSIVTVGTGLEVNQAGGIWDLDLANYSIEFRIDSIFGNLVSGDDIYRFIDVDNRPSRYSIVGFTAVPLGSQSFLTPPEINLLGRNGIEVLFPKGFARDLNKIPDGDLAFRIDLIVEPTQVPTPALLPGLVGVGVATWRRLRCNDSTDD